MADSLSLGDFFFPSLQTKPASRSLHFCHGGQKRADGDGGEDSDKITEVLSR